ncbi:hypothetical protein TNCV_1939101 [Trichonephila clavipes]|nr:hypothetical protein TNCV_1939101 [Trichonephila clavipes]
MTDVRGKKSPENCRGPAFKADQITSKRIRYGFITVQSITLIGAQEHNFAGHKTKHCTKGAFIRCGTLERNGALATPANNTKIGKWNNLNPCFRQNGFQAKMEDLALERGLISQQGFQPKSQLLHCTLVLFFSPTNNVTRRETKSNDNKELSYYIEKGSVPVNRHRDKGWWCFNESGSVGGRPGVHFVILPEWVTVCKASIIKLFWKMGCCM